MDLLHGPHNSEGECAPRKLDSWGKRESEVFFERDDIVTRRREIHFPFCSVEEKSSPANQMDMDAPHLQNDNPDLVHSIKGMYRVLDLISERGTGGLVGKIIVSNNTLKEFINSISPGACSSATRVNFGALDEHLIKPVGVYGSKEEIVRFLSHLGVINQAIAARLLVDSDAHICTQPCLRSGLYIIRAPKQTPGSHQIFVIFWPEKTTWDDAAESSVVRNRTAFMTYLTRICDQVVCLISPEHAQTIIWSGDGDIDHSDISRVGEDKSDQMFKFEVTQTDAQESVTVREGFKAVSEAIRLQEIPPEDPDSLKTAPLSPFLLFGETAQGFMTVEPRDTLVIEETFAGCVIEGARLQTLLASDRLRLNEKLGDGALRTLLRAGLENRFPEPCMKWKHETIAVASRLELRIQREIGLATARLKMELPALQRSIFEVILDEVLRLYPCFDRGAFACCADNIATSVNGHQSLKLSPKANESISQQLREFQRIDNQEFQTAKDRISSFKELVPLLKKKHLNLDTQTYLQILKTVLEGEEGNYLTDCQNEPESSSDLTTDVEKEIFPFATENATRVSDRQFLTQLERDAEQFAQHIPQFNVLADKARQRAFKYLEAKITKMVKELAPVVRGIQELDTVAEIKLDHEKRANEEQDKLRVDFIKHMNNLSAQTTYTHTFTIDNADSGGGRVGGGKKGYKYSVASSWRIWGSRASEKDSKTIYTVHMMSLTTLDQHKMQSSPQMIPSPQFKFSHTFSLPSGDTVVRAQLLEGEKLLLVVADRAGNLCVYLDGLMGIECSIARGRGKQLNREKIGHEFLLVYDESKRMLAVVSSDKLLLHIFAFDDMYGFQAVGSSINLRPWYSTEGLSIQHACFVSGSEELFLVDSQAHGRIFSLVTDQFHPATLQLDRVPYNVSSTPDGACLLVAQIQGDDLAMTAYHWSTFGTTEGIPLDLGSLTEKNSPVISSLISRGAVHLVVLDFDAHACRSYALDITRQVTKFTFEQRGSRGGNMTPHNCLIGCHADVWTQFPVLPPVQRQTISPSNLRSVQRLLFVTDRDYGRYVPQFAKLINTFETMTKKPTGDVLKSIDVFAASFSIFAAEVCGSGDINVTRKITWDVSAYRAGEWLAELLCLIPIHIAVVRENCFVPLKDGVHLPEQDRTSFGGAVNRIVDYLSFGWYESLFQSYMASKPVKVVSSMGERSVGKSFMLNHLVGTSFAGSAKQTTEGVWMSVTPTKEELIVALDFEGLNNSERSAQENALLVLFSTAISNLMLLRGNFAPGRDITGLFQPFHSSSALLDPKGNPSLFQSTLVVTIKDVVDSDRADIANEFSVKLRRIVEEEQDANFVSRLHAGKLNIIPWPAICSTQFYKLFTMLKKMLDDQAVTHRSAREFLHFLKTLMAKVKVNDWSAMSQTLVSHRAHLISTRLSNALAFGYATVRPVREPLKSVDTDVAIDLPDTPYQLFIGRSGNPFAPRERTLAILRGAWKNYSTRQHITEDEWIAGLKQHLEAIVNLRITRVREWLDQNLAQFQAAGDAGASQAWIDQLKREVETSITELRDSVQLCELTCASCNLRCVQSRSHEGSHNCHSEHVCVHECGFCLALEPSEHRPCTMSAGHAGKHVCVASQHLCADTCKFSERYGCMGVCAKEIDHSEEEHLCAAPTHACGKPCALSNVHLSDESAYSCPGTCWIPSDFEHVLHQCDAQFCTIQCQLCKRQCAGRDHIHGLDAFENHLCGQEHFCDAVCAVPGICEVETFPQPVETACAGESDISQYTKYHQVAKRLKCVIPIPPGATKHTGPHCHSLDKKVVHFCEAKCEGCGYFCTLPFGHGHREHETRHGPMLRPLWAADKPDDIPLELGGQNLTLGKKGTPMMCNLVCSGAGPHVHVDYCRADHEASCSDNMEVQHLTNRLRIWPDPDREKDVLTHELFWKRSGFKDPYSREERASFGNAHDCRTLTVIR